METYEDLEITILWGVEDNYAGKSRPQETVFTPCDWCDEEDWNNKTTEQKKELIVEAVQEDFDNRIYFGIYDFGSII